ncbi:MAG: TOBE domain-containing protein [Caulobacteraceae bacterium]|nr:TOBE domain-containing protein [Caulobacteraceae bacterium]
MSTLRVEQIGEELIIRITSQARNDLGLRPGDEVQLARSIHGEISLAPSDMDHQIRLERSRAFLRRFQGRA